MTPIFPICCFQNCARDAMLGKPQCDVHKKKRLCAIDGCASMVNKRGLCVRHGARHGRCSVLGCEAEQVRVGTLCYAHSLVVPRCEAADMRKQSREAAQEKYASDDVPADPANDWIEWVLASLAIDNHDEWMDGSLGEMYVAKDDVWPFSLEHDDTRIDMDEVLALKLFGL
ncbi:Aste57867_19889 [Aphanomyces stellatus]|uniref:Aste57867_19889 protein n=1 Tax=Aphanomyces stellatus TaxID=120398 RepID=A0A485LFK2_9STRA|nr:hypothetical protein As57867_019823 [Aphanomyces stellatus]VFT96587.1 Aste57867_19889 [Aphanomyces stellatus]